MGFFNGQLNGEAGQPSFFRMAQMPVMPKKAPPPKPLPDKVVDFLGLRPAVDVFGAHIAKAQAPEELKQYVEQPTALQTLGAVGQVGATVLPFNMARNLAVRGATGVSSVIGKELIGAAAQGAAAGYTYDVSSDLAEGKTGAGVLTPGIGTAVGFFGGPLLVGAGKTIASRALRGKTPEQFAEEAAARAPYTVPEAGKPTPAQAARVEVTQGPKLLPEKATPEPIRLPSPQITASQRAINEIPTPVVAPKPVPDKNSPDINLRAEAFNSRNDFIKAEQAKNIGTKIVTSKTGQAIEKPVVLRKVSETQLAKIWDKAHEIKPYEMLPSQKSTPTIGKSPKIGKSVVQENQIVTPTKVETGGIPASKTSPETVGYKEREIPQPETKPKYTEEEFQKDQKTLQEDPVYVPGTDKEKIETFREVYESAKKSEKDMNDFIDSIYEVNGKSLPKNLPRSSAFKLLWGRASELTPKQLERIVNDEPLSKAGQDLQAAKVKAGEIVTDPQVIIAKLKKDLQEKASKLLTKNGVRNFLDELECK